jgi:hypothetical protein
MGGDNRAQQNILLRSIHFYEGAPARPSHAE